MQGGAYFWNFTVCTLTGVVPVAKKARYGHEVGLEMRRTPSL